MTLIKACETGAIEEGATLKLPIENGIVLVLNSGEYFALADE
jgi:nitrite reductase/ring-hydroxylating ferredoxin subunit